MTFDAISTARAQSPSGPQRISGPRSAEQLRIDRLEAVVDKLGGALELVVRELEHGLRGAVAATPDPASAHRKRDISQRLRELNKARRAAAVQTVASQVNDHAPLAAKAKAEKTVVADASAAPPVSGLQAAIARGEAARIEWVRSGEVVPAKALADAWGLTPQALGPAATRGELFTVVVKRQRHYPREFLELDRGDVGTVCKALSGLSPEEQLVFWKRPHGTLRGKTAAQLLADGRSGLPTVLRLAQAAARNEAAAGAVA